MPPVANYPLPSTGARPERKGQISIVPVEFPAHAVAIDPASDTASPLTAIPAGMEAKTTAQTQNADLVVGAMIHSKTLLLGMLVHGHPVKRKLIAMAKFTAVDGAGVCRIIFTYKWAERAGASPGACLQVVDFTTPLGLALQNGPRVSIFVQLLDAKGRVLPLGERYLTEGDGDDCEFHGCHPRGVLIPIVPFVPQCMRPHFVKAKLIGPHD